MLNFINISLDDKIKNEALIVKIVTVILTRFNEFKFCQDLILLS